MPNSNLSFLFSNIKIQEPQIQIEELSQSQGILTVKPLIKGYGTTLGNSLRRVLLSSLPGSAIIGITITANNQTLLHEFSAIQGVKEDVCEIILNLKGVILKQYSAGIKKAYLHIDSGCEVTAGMIQTADDIEIVNKEHYIATTSPNTQLDIEMIIDAGVGYVSAEQNKKKYGNQNATMLFIDSIFTPVQKVNFEVDKMNIGGNLENDQLELSVYTNGAVSPKESIILSAEILKTHYSLLSLNNDDSVSLIVEDEEKKSSAELDRSIDELDFSVRSYNCLKRAGINTIGQLTEKTYSDMLKIRNLGAKSFDEIEKKLQDIGLSFKGEEL